MSILTFIKQSTECTRGVPSTQKLGSNEKWAKCAKILLLLSPVFSSSNDVNQASAAAVPPSTSSTEAQLGAGARWTNYKYKYKHKYKIQIQKNGFIKTFIEGMTKDVASEAHAKRQKEIR